MLQIDDSGWGSIIGGACIGVYNTDNNKLYSRLIPVKYFQGKKFKDKDYLDAAWDIAIHGMTSVCKGTINTKTTVQICRGFLLSKIREMFLSLKNEFLNVEFVEINKPLQPLLEEQFSKSLERYGVPKISDGAHRMSFDDMVRWVNEDLKNREKYVKTGWDSWKAKYRNKKT